MGWQAIENKVLKSFDILLGIPSGAISTEFRHRVREVLKEKYPDGMERSALRDLIEGQLGGMPVPPSTARRARANYGMILMDVLETLKKETLVCSLEGDV